MKRSSTPAVTTTGVCWPCSAIRRDASRTWHYSDDGNLLGHAGHALGYDDTHPHAAVNYAGQALGYDAGGHPLGRSTPWPSSPFVHASDL